MASRYPPEWLEELRARADIVSIVSEYVPLKQNGRRYWGLCPFHNEKTASFSVDQEQGLYYCFGCKAGGSVIQFVMDAERMEFSEAVRYLAEKLRMPLPAQGSEADAASLRSQRERIQELNRKAAHIFHQTLYAKEGAHILDYLHGRGLDDPVIRLFGLGAAPAGWDTLTKQLMAEGATAEELVLAGLAMEKEKGRFDMFRNRAIFPIVSAHGAVLGFGGRAMGEAQPKYLNTSDTPAFNKRQNVYAQNMLRKARGLPRVLLVEGYMDVVSLVRHGVQGVAATLGTALTPEQAKLMKRYAPEIWVAYDGDAAGQNATLKALDVLGSLEIPARVLVFPDGLDPDEFIRERGREAFDALKPLSAQVYRMQRAADGLDLSTEEGRTKYAIDCASILRTVKQPVELENLLKRLMVETGYSREVLVQQIGSVAPEKSVYTPRVKREKLPSEEKASHAPSARRDNMATRREGNRFLPDHLKAERTLLSLMGAGLVPKDTVTADRFTDVDHRGIAEALLAGKRAAVLLEECEEDGLRGIMLEVFGTEPRIYGDELMRMIAECLERMRRGWIDERIRALIGKLPQAATEEKKKMLDEIQDLNQEKERLRPGRKE